MARQQSLFYDKFNWLNFKKNVQKKNFPNEKQKFDETYGGESPKNTYGSGRIEVVEVNFCERKHWSLR